MISATSRDHIVACIDKAEAAGGKPLVDGRGWAKRRPGTWVGPTVILKGKGGAAPAAEEPEEIFGPVLMVLKVRRQRRAMGWKRFRGGRRGGGCPKRSVPALIGARFVLFVARQAGAQQHHLPFVRGVCFSPAGEGSLVLPCSGSAPFRTVGSKVSLPRLSAASHSWRFCVYAGGDGGSGCGSWCCFLFFCPNAAHSFLPASC